jgi:hypothetical protein
VTLRSRLSWWLFLARYRIARWRGKMWATGPMRPELIYAYRERTRAGDFVDPPDGRSDYGYFNGNAPTPRVWDDPHAR